MAGVDHEFLEQLKSRTDLVDLIGSYIPLEKKGANYWACCPFHKEKTPSFSVNAQDQYYHCFGCGVSGDAISFVQAYESVDFMDAVRLLAQRAKIPVPEMNFDSEKTAEEKRRRDEILKILRDSARFYYANLSSPRAAAHRQYLEGRKISREVQVKFGLGASVDFGSLPEYLLDLGHSPERIVESGAVVRRERDGKLTDSLGGRLIYPVINAYGDVIAFGGRVLEKTDFAKYKNTRETAVFNKSKALYNINLVKKEKNGPGIRQLVIVEGYMDTISLWQAGFHNVAASMGTSLTREQARLAKRYAGTVSISYDGDFAGQKGALRGLDILKEEGLSVRVVLLPEGLDPDDVVRQGGPDSYRKCLEEAVPLPDFKLICLARQHDLSKTEGKRAYAQEALAVIGQEPSTAVQDELLKEVRKKTGYTYEALRRDLDRGTAGPEETVSAGPKPEAPAAKKEDALLVSERFILAACLFGAEYARDFPLESVRFSDPVHNLAAEYVQRQRKEGKAVRPSALFDIAGTDSGEVSALLNLNDGTLSSPEKEQYFRDCIATVRERECDAQLKLLLAQDGPDTDPEERARIRAELSKLLREKMRYKK